MPEIQADHLPLVGPIYYRILLARQSVPVTFTDALVRRYLAETVDC